MATAVEPSSAPSAPGKAANLPVASLLGAIYVLAALAVVFFALPVLWADYLSPVVGHNRLLDWTLWFLAIGGTLLVLGWFGLKLAGTNPPVGLRGGVFLMVVTALVIFFVARYFALAFEGATGLAVGGAVALLLIFLAGRFFGGTTGRRWMVSLEEQGWFSVHLYKRSLGVRVRRLTIMGILLIGATGAYSLFMQGTLPDRWTLEMPVDFQTFALTKSTVTVMRSANVVIPALLVLATLWIAFRSVNVPTFAEFLIATEAEMNKVSWSTRKRLAQDTVVVLLTTLIMTLFLLVVDLFWGWLLSRQTVGVLPSRATGVEQKAEEAKW